MLRLALRIENHPFNPMLDSGESLYLNEDLIKNLPEDKRPIFIYQWLNYLNQVLTATQQNDLEQSQAKLIDQLLYQAQYGPGPPIRFLLGQTLTNLLSRTDTSALFYVIHHCHGLIQSKEDLPKLTATAILGALYERFGRLLDRLYAETIPILINLLKDGDSQTRYEIFVTLERLVKGLTNNGNQFHREISKVAKNHLCDRKMPVRSAVTRCLITVIQQNPSVSQNELEGNIALVFRAFDGSNHDVRRHLARYLAILLLTYQNITSQTNSIVMTKSMNTGLHTKSKKIDDILGYLSCGFQRGTIRYPKMDTSEYAEKPITVQHQIRIGVTYTYVEWVQMQDSLWIEENLSILFNHLFDLLGICSTSSQQSDAHCSDRYLIYIIRSIVNIRSDERFRLLIAKEFLSILVRYTSLSSPISTTHSLHSSTNSILRSSDSIQHVLICALHGFYSIVTYLRTSIIQLVQDRDLNLFETLFITLIHSSYSVRISTAWCLRLISMLLPSLRNPLIEKCLEKIRTITKPLTIYNADVLSGYALALESLLGTVYQSSLGIPFRHVKMIFDFADDLLRTLTSSVIEQEQSFIPRLLVQRLHVSWNLLASCASLERYYFKPFFTRLVRLCHHVFPRSLTDLKQEHQRGDSFTWTLTFNQRANALCSIMALLIHHSSEDVVQSFSNPITNAILCLLHIPTIIKHFGPSLKGPAMVFRLRLYQLLTMIPNRYYEQHWKLLLRILAGEMTLSDNPLNSTTSLLRSMCPENTQILFDNDHCHNTTHQIIEETLHSHHSVHFRPSVFEHDETDLYLHHSSINGQSIPLNVAVIDASIILFSQLFPLLEDKYHQAMSQRFLEIIRLTKGPRQEAIEMNLITALSMALKNFTCRERSIYLSDGPLKKSLCTLILHTICHTNSTIRCASSQVLNQLIEVTNDLHLRSDLTRICLERLKNARDIPSRTGYSLGLAHLCHSSQHINRTVSILQTFAQDSSASIVQCWALHALLIIAESTGSVYRHQHLESTLSLILNLLLTVPSYHQDLIQCSARLLIVLIRLIGNEFQMNTNSMSTIRSSCLTASQLLQNQSIIESIDVLQELHVVLPRYVNLSRIIPELIRTLMSRNESMKYSALIILKELSSQEAKDICEYTKEFLGDFEENPSDEFFNCSTLQEFLFALLDQETDDRCGESLETILKNLLEASGAKHAKQWLKIFEKILLNPKDATNHRSDRQNNDDDDDDDNGKEEEEDEELITNDNSNHFIPPISSSSQWKTKIFAIHCVERLLVVCEQSTFSHLHFDSRTEFNEDYLVFHLNTLVNLSVSACRSSSDVLRSAGLKLLLKIIRKFSSKKKTSMNLLNDYQTQICAALRPSFSTNSSSILTNQTCEVFSTWISTGIGPDLGDLRRAHQLLISSLRKLITTKTLSDEETLTVENLAVLKLWADVYNEIVQRRNQSNETFFQLLQSEFDLIVHHWLAAITDDARLNLPEEFGGKPNKIDRNGNFYSIPMDENRIKTLFQTTSFSLIQSTTHWLVEHDFQFEIVKSSSANRHDAFLTKFFSLTLSNSRRIVPSTRENVFHLLLGSCVYRLSNSNNDQIDEMMLDTLLSALTNLIRSNFAVDQITTAISTDLLRVFQRLLLTHEDFHTQLKIVKLIENLFEIHFKSSTSNESLVLPFVQCLSSIIVKSDVHLIDDFPLNTTSMIELLPSLIDLFDKIISLISNDVSREKLHPVILHVLFSAAFVILTRQSETEENLLNRIFRYVEPKFLQTLSKINGQFLVTNLIQLRMKLLENSISDQNYFLRCLTEILSHCPSIKLNNQIIHFYQQTFEDRKFSSKQLEIYQCFNQIFQSKNLSLRNAFIRIFTSQFVIELRHCEDQQEILAILNIFETLLAVVKLSSRVRLAALIIPLYINYLPDSSTQSDRSNLCFHQHIYGRVEHFMTIYSNEIRSLLRHTPELRSKFRSLTSKSISTEMFENRE